MSEYIHLNSIFRDRTANTNPCNYELSASQVSKWNEATRDVRSLPQNSNVRPPNFTSSIELVNVVLPYPRIELYAFRSITVDNISGGNTLNTIDPHGLSVNDIVMTSAASFGNISGINRNVEYHVIATPTSTSFQVSLTQGGLLLSLTNGTGLNMQLSVITPSEYASVMTALDSGLTLLDMPVIYVDFHCILYKDQNYVRAIDNNISRVKFVIQFDKYQVNSVGMLNWIHYKVNMTQVIRMKLNSPVRLTYYDQYEQPLMMFDEPNETFNTDPNLQNVVTLSVTPYIRDNHFSNHTSEPISS